MSSNIHYFGMVNSTMDIAREMAKNGCPDFTVVVAEQQKNGRGRMNRAWLSDIGGLYFTLVLRPDINLTKVSIINFLISLGIVRVLRSKFNLDARVKWPNDILIFHQKICGILSEMETESDSDSVKFINIGIGLNVNNYPLVKDQNVTSLKLLLYKELDKMEILLNILDEFKKLINESFNNIVSEWKMNTITLNKKVEIVTLKETIKGTAIDIDENGSLVLETDEGLRKQIYYGDCFV
ncbi:MAG: biotin--[acetyl-CoA-carboxylase] ligase [Desulfobacterales bacterium]|nr:biotin--[acetyl-CoA-carboxylase] ligase [Desulfobacterales bacterium]